MRVLNGRKAIGGQDLHAIAIDAQVVEHEARRGARHARILHHHGVVRPSLARRHRSKADAVAYANAHLVLRPLEHHLQAGYVVEHVGELVFGACDGIIVVLFVSVQPERGRAAAKGRGGKRTVRVPRPVRDKGIPLDAACPYRQTRPQRHVMSIAGHVPDHPVRDGIHRKPNDGIRQIRRPQASAGQHYPQNSPFHDHAPLLSPTTPFQPFNVTWLSTASPSGKASCRALAAGRKR